MRLILDTHALLWWLGGEAMADGAIAAIGDPSALVVVSAASVWECAIKAALGKLAMPAPLADAIVEEGFEPLSINVEHAARAGQLPGHHRDPFDRMLIAQAQVERLTIVSRDPAFDDYEVDVLPC